MTGYLSATKGCFPKYTTYSVSLMHFRVQWTFLLVNYEMCWFMRSDLNSFSMANMMEIISWSPHIIYPIASTVLLVHQAIPKHNQWYSRCILHLKLIMLYFPEVNQFFFCILIHYIYGLWIIFSRIFEFHIHCSL